MIRMTWCCTKFGLKSVETCVVQGRDNLLLESCQQFSYSSMETEGCPFGGYTYMGFGGRTRERESGLFVTGPFIK